MTMNLLVNLKDKRRVIVRTPDPECRGEIRFLTTNDAVLRDETVMRIYALRNWVEVSYREAKDDLGAGQYQVRSLNSIVRHWLLVFVAYSFFMQLLRKSGRLSRWCEKNSAHSVRR